MCDGNLDCPSCEYCFLCFTIFIVSGSACKCGQTIYFLSLVVSFKELAFENAMNWKSDTFFVHKYRLPTDKGLVPFICKHITYIECTKSYFETARRSKEMITQWKGESQVSMAPTKNHVYLYVYFPNIAGDEGKHPLICGKCVFINTKRRVICN